MAGMCWGDRWGHDAGLVAPACRPHCHGRRRRDPPRARDVSNEPPPPAPRRPDRAVWLVRFPHMPVVRFAMDPSTSSLLVNRSSCTANTEFRARWLPHHAWRVSKPCQMCNIVFETDLRTTSVADVYHYIPVHSRFVFAARRGNEGEVGGGGGGGQIGCGESALMVGHCLQGGLGQHCGVPTGRECGPHYDLSVSRPSGR